MGSKNAYNYCSEVLFVIVLGSVVTHDAREEAEEPIEVVAVAESLLSQRRNP